MSWRQEKRFIPADYSKSYNNTQQDEIQSAYCSIFTSCSYYCEAQNDNLAKISIAVISESSDHSRIAAFTCNGAIVNELKKRMKDSLKKVILWSDGCSSQCLSKYVFVLMTHFDKSVQLQWHYNEAHHGKAPMDGVGGTIKSGFCVSEIKQNHDTHSGRICNGGFRGCAFHSINLPFTRWWDNQSIVCQSHFIHSGTLDTHYVKRSFNSNGACFLEFHKSSNNLEPFHGQYYSWANTLVCDDTGSESNKNEFSFCKKLYHEDERWLQSPSCKIWFREERFGK